MPEKVTPLSNLENAKVKAASDFTAWKYLYTDRSQASRGVPVSIFLEIRKKVIPHQIWPYFHRCYSTERPLLHPPCRST